MDFNYLTSLNISLIAGIIGAVLLILSLAKGYKDKGTKVIMTWLAIGGIVIAVLPAFMPVAFLTDPLGGATIAVSTGTIPTQSVVGGICGVEDTTVTISAVDAYTEASAGTTHRYRVNNGPALTVANAGTFTASPGDVISVLYGNETDGTYYGFTETETLPCAGTKTISDKIYRNGTLTVEVFNEEGNLIDGVENETLANGDVVTLSSKLKGTYQRGFPHGGVIVAEFNGTGTSTIDDVIVNFGGSETSVPGIYAITLGTNARTKAFTVPAILSNQIIEGKIVIDVDDTNNPVGTGDGDVVLTFYANDYFIDDDNSGAFAGPKVTDEDNVQTFLHTTASTLHID